MTDIALTWPEIRHAAYTGIDRFIRNRANNNRPTYGVDTDGWQPDILGAWGELAVAKTADTYWTGDLGHTDQGAPDVGPYHVRTRSKPEWDLILHQQDDDHGIYVLVVPLGLPRFRIVGWCHGYEGKQPDYWQTFTGRPAYFVPQSALRPWEALTHLDTWDSLAQEAG